MKSAQERWGKGCSQGEMDGDESHGGCVTEERDNLDIRQWGDMLRCYNILDKGQRGDVVKGVQF